MEFDRMNWIEAFEVDGNEIWFIPTYFPFLVRYSITQNEILEIIRIPQDISKDGKMIRLFSTIHIIEDSLYLIPIVANCVLKYNIHEKSFSRIFLDKNYFKDENYNFYKSVLFDNSIVLYSDCYKIIVTISCKDDEVSYFDIINNGAIYEKVICYNCYNPDIQWVFNQNNKLSVIQNRELQTIFSIDETMSIRAIYCDISIVSLIIVEDSITYLYTYDVLTKCSNKTKLLAVNSAHYIASFMEGNTIHFLPSNQGDCYVKYNIETKNVEYTLQKNSDVEYYAFSNLKKYKNIFWSYDIISNSFIKMINGTTIIIPLDIFDEIKLMHKILYKIKNDSICFEAETVSIAEYFRFLKLV